MLSTTRSAGRKSKHSMKKRSTRPGSSAAIRAWSIQCPPTPRMSLGHASGLIDPVSVPVNSMSENSSRVCSEGRVTRTPSPTVMFSPRLNRPVVAPNCEQRFSNSAMSSSDEHL